MTIEAIQFGRDSAELIRQIDALDAWPNLRDHMLDWLDALEKRLQEPDFDYSPELDKFRAVMNEIRCTFSCLVIAT